MIEKQDCSPQTLNIPLHIKYMSGQGLQGGEDLELNRVMEELKRFCWDGEISIDVLPERVSSTRALHQLKESCILQLANTNHVARSTSQI